MSYFNLDYETYSAADLKTVGAWRYAADPSTEILLCAIAKEDGPVEIWDCHASDEANAPALSLLQDLILEEDTVWAHNVQFEHAISTYLWEKTFGFRRPALKQWRCTAALARIAAIPSSLEKSAEFLGSTDGKDPTGTALIKVFSVPRKSKARGIYRSLPSDEGKVTVAGKKIPPAEAWGMFRNYCIKDVVVQRWVLQKIHHVSPAGSQYAAFLSDLKMAERGIPVDLGAVINAEKLVDDYKVVIGGRFREITGYGDSQRDKVFQWLKARGYPADDLRANTVGRITGWDLEEDDGTEEDADEVIYDSSKMTPEAMEALKLRALLSFAALKKLPAMRKGLCPDGRIHGAITWYGASRTGRASSRKPLQMHNMKRPTVNTELWEETHGEPETHHIFRMIKEGYADMGTLDMVFGPPMECIASSIRHFVGYGDRQILDIDLAQIEARVLAWLAGHHTLLQAFRDGKDLYKITASLLWGMPYEAVTKGERFLGKVASLACGYQGGVNAFAAMALIYGAKIPPEQAAAVVKAYRKGNPAITSLWKITGEAAVEAISTPGIWVKVNDKISFGTSNKLGYQELLMRLPSGRTLHYPLPEVKVVYKRQNAEKKWVPIPERLAIDQATGEKKDGIWVTNEISYWGQVKQSNRWARVTTHGGVFVENACQAVAGDFLTNGILCAESAGYDPLFTVHDQGLFDYHPDRGNTVSGLVAAFTTVPPWAPGFPLAAEAQLADFYTK